MTNFWENGEFYIPLKTGGMDAHLAGDSTVLDHVQAHQTEILSGTRVAFPGSLSALLAYPDPPARGDQGTVVLCRTASGDQTSHDGMVFVKWDSGRFFPVHLAHVLRIKSPTRVANVYRRSVKAMGDLTDFMKSASDELIHKSSKDLWKLSKSGDDYVIERLFDGKDGQPLKV